MRVKPRIRERPIQAWGVRWAAVARGVGVVDGESRFAGMTELGSALDGSRGESQGLAGGQRMERGGVERARLVCAVWEAELAL